MQLIESAQVQTGFPILVFMFAEQQNCCRLHPTEKTWQGQLNLEVFLLTLWENKVKLEPLKTNFITLYPPVIKVRYLPRRLALFSENLIGQEVATLYLLIFNVQGSQLKLP